MVMEAEIREFPKIGYSQQSSWILCTMIIRWFFSPQKKHHCRQPNFEVFWRYCLHFTISGHFSRQFKPHFRPHFVCGCCCAEMPPDRPRWICGRKNPFISRLFFVIWWHSATLGDIWWFLQCFCVSLCFSFVSWPFRCFIVSYWPGHAAFRVFKEETAWMGTIRLSGRAAGAAGRMRNVQCANVWNFLHILFLYVFMFLKKIRSVEISVLM